MLEELREETTEEEEVSVVKNEVPRTGGEADAVTAEETSADEDVYKRQTFICQRTSVPWIR